MDSVLPTGAPTVSLEGLLDNWQTLLSDSRVQLANAAILAPALAIFLWFFVSYYTSPLKNTPGLSCR